MMAIEQGASLDQVVATALEQLVSFTGADGAECHLVDADGRLQPVGHYNMDAGFAAASEEYAFSPGVGIPGFVFQTRASLYVPVIAEESRYIRRDVALAAGYTCLLCVPILGGEYPTGTFMLYGRQPITLTDTILSSLVDIGSHFAAVIERVKLLTQTRQQVRELELVNHIVSAAVRGVDENELLSTTCAELAKFLGASRSIILLLNESADELLVLEEYPEHDTASAVGVSIPIEDSVTWRDTLQHGRPLIIADIEDYPLEAGRELLKKRGTKALLVVPIPLRLQTIGVIALEMNDSRQFMPQEVGMAQTAASQLGQAMENTRLYARLRAHANELEQRVAERTNELSQANDRLQELDRLKSKFVADVSHELRTPVTNLKLHLELLSLKSKGYEKYISILMAQIDRLGRRIEDILDVSRLEMEQDKISFQLVDLNYVAKLVIAAHLLRAEAAGLDLIFEPGSESALVWGEPNQLAQVVTNLVANAVNYTHAGEIRVKIYEDQERNQACLQVEDTGMGIPKEDMPHLFERFYRGQLTAQSEIPGTGLGLGIVKEIVTIHNGEIEATSEVGTGSVFRVWLPLADEGN